jgi:radical SAM superfamily enzyme YgiQ (UPF0313 family)
MNVAFVQNLWEELTGPMILAEILEREGHQVRFFLEERGFRRKIGAFDPDVIALSVCTGQHPWYLDFAKKAKDGLPKRPLIVMGGPHPTFFPEVIHSPGIDAICRGEGEIAFPGFLRGIRNGEPPQDVPGFIVKRDGKIHEAPVGRVVKRLDDIPIPKRTPLYDHYPYIRDSPHRKIMAGRGCPFNCHFCFNESMRTLTRRKGPYIRIRSPENVLTEIEYIRHRFGVQFVEFTDDLFSLNRSWAMEFLGIYKVRAGVPFGVNVHARFIDDGLARALKEAGCNSVSFGIESGSEKNRWNLLGKDVTNLEMIRCAEILRRNGLSYRTFNIMGLPGETLEEAMETVRFNQAIKPDFGGCTLAVPLPGTRFAGICSEMTGISEGEYMERINKSWFDSSAIPGPDADNIRNLHKFFGILVRYPKLEPLVRFLMRLPPNPVFRLIHQIYYGLYQKKRAHVGWERIIPMYLRVRKHY